MAKRLLLAVRDVMRAYRAHPLTEGSPRRRSATAHPESLWRLNFAPFELRRQSQRHLAKRRRLERWNYTAL